MFIASSMSGSSHAYMQAVNSGIEHSDVCKKEMEYCVLFDTLGEEHIEKEMCGSLQKL
jgi:hypothetical protein